MSILLRLKHWQFFVLLILMPCIPTLLFTSPAQIQTNPFQALIILMIMTLIQMLLVCIWLHTLSSWSYRRLPAQVVGNFHLLKFRIFLSVPVLYMALFLFLIMTNPLNPSILLPVVLLHLFSMFCVFYCLYFTAKILKSAETQILQKSFGGFSEEFFLLWFFPIGIWILQPRINKFFAKAGTNNADDQDA
jgi:hypothetical protein